MPRRIFISVGEVSGDNHAAKLIVALKQLDPDIIVEGLGGPAMQQAGAIIHHETTQRAAMTIHAYKRIFEMKHLLNWTRNRYQSHRPDLHICVDSSGVNLRFARIAKKAGIPVLYFVAPQLWASREGRIKQVRAYVDQLACILPFEESWYRQRGATATFVGHPLFDALPHGRLEAVSPDHDGLVVGILPGSRKSEVKENFPHLLDVMDKIHAILPDVRYVIPTTPAADPLVKGFLSNRALSKITVKENGFDELIPGCDLVLTKSGTSTLHVAAWGIPMIVVYRIHRVLWHVIGKHLIKTPKIALVNILAGNTDLVPEFIPWYGSNQPVADCAIELLRHPEKRLAQRQKLIELVRTLDRQGASQNVAKMAIDMIDSAKVR